jgi:hypothetical protein
MVIVIPVKKGNPEPLLVEEARKYSPPFTRRGVSVC